MCVCACARMHACALGESLHQVCINTNEEEKLRWRVNTEAPSALQSHLFDTQREGGEGWREGGEGDE